MIVEINPHTHKHNLHSGNEHSAFISEKCVYSPLIDENKINKYGRETKTSLLYLILLSEQRYCNKFRRKIYKIHQHNSTRIENLFQVFPREKFARVLAKEENLYKY